MPDAPPDNAPHLYEAERRRKRDELVAMGENPYGERVRDVEPLENVRAAFRVGMDHGQDDAIRFTVAGRVVLKRDMGKLSFLTLRDDTGDLQVALQKNALTDGNGRSATASTSATRSSSAARSAPPRPASRPFGRKPCR